MAAVVLASVVSLLAVALPTAAPAAAAPAAAAPILTPKTEMDDYLARGVARLSACKPVTDAFASLEAAPEFVVESDLPVRAGYLRFWDMNVGWRDINPEAGKYDYSVLDARIAQAKRNNSKVLYVFGLTPKWAATDPELANPLFGAGSASPPRDEQDFLNFVSALVDHVGNKVDAYELWNEGNLKTFWNGSADQLARMTAKAYAIIKAKQPGAIVIAPSTTTRTTGLMSTFMNGFLRAAATTSPAYAFDAFTIHSYPGGQQAPSNRIDQVRSWQMVVAANLGPDSPVLDRPIWDTEVNYGLKGPGDQPATDFSDDAGAQLMLQTYEDSKALGIDATFWYMLTKDPFDLLGVQFTPSTPATMAAWSTIRRAFELGANPCPSDKNPLGNSSAVADPNQIAQFVAASPNANPLPDAVPPVPLPDSIAPKVGETTTVVNNVAGQCNDAANASTVVSGCGPVDAVNSSAVICQPSGSAPESVRMATRTLPTGLFSQITSGGILQNFLEQLLTSPFSASAGYLPDGPGSPGSSSTLLGPGGVFTFTPLPPSQQPLVSSVGPYTSTPDNASPCPTTRAGFAKSPAPPTFARGTMAVLRAGGFGANKPVTVYVGTSKTPAARLAATAQGNVSAWFTVPRNAALGNSTVQVIGILGNGKTASFTSGIVIRKGVPTRASGTIAMDAKPGVLSKKEQASINRVLAKAFPPSACTLASAPRGAKASIANAKAVNAYLTARGVTCKTVQPKKAKSTKGSKGATVTLSLQAMS